MPETIQPVTVLIMLTVIFVSCLITVFFECGFAKSIDIEMLMMSSKTHKCDAASSNDTSSLEDSMEITDALLIQILFIIIFNIYV